MEKENELLKSFGIGLIIFICSIALLEACILGLSFIYADEINCNWLWCEFSTTRRSIEDNTIILTSSTVNQDIHCYKNGEEVNCTSIKFPNFLEYK